MKKTLLFILLSLFCFSLTAQQAGFEKQEICWTDTAGVDSSLTRIVFISNMADTAWIITYLNEQGQEVDVSSGGTFAAGFCGCCEDGSGSGSGENFANANLTIDSIVRVHNIDSNNVVIQDTIVGRNGTKWEMNNSGIIDIEADSIVFRPQITQPLTNDSVYHPAVVTIKPKPVNPSYSDVLFLNNNPYMFGKISGGLNLIEDDPNFLASYKMGIGWYSGTGTSTSIFNRARKASLAMKGNGPFSLQIQNTQLEIDVRDGAFGNRSVYDFGVQRLELYPQVLYDIGNSDSTGITGRIYADSVLSIMADSIILDTLAQSAKGDQLTENPDNLYRMTAIDSAGVLRLVNIDTLLSGGINIYNSDGKLPELRTMETDSFTLLLEALTPNAGMANASTPLQISHESKNEFFFQNVIKGTTPSDTMVVYFNDTDLWIETTGSMKLNAGTTVDIQDNTNISGTLGVFGDIVLGGSGGPVIRSGTGSPETVVTAPVGSLFLRTDGGAGTTLYVKESGTGNTGWVAK